MKSLEANSVDAIVTDPPYGWRFMGKAWDGADIERVAKDKERKPRDLPAESAGTYDQSWRGNEQFQIFSESWAREAFRVLKPGGHMLVFCGPRTYHRMASGVEDAGFEIRDQLQWLFGSGFPKSHNIGNGIGTALKPANEPIVLARKPLEKGLTVAQNVAKWGVGGLNIDASRIEGLSEKELNWTPQRQHAKTSIDVGGARPGQEMSMFNPKGRWPSNLLLDESAAAMLDEQSGVLKTGGVGQIDTPVAKSNIGFTNKRTARITAGSFGGASRFFYVAKASKRERNAGLEGMPDVTTRTGCHGEMPVDDDGKERDRFSVKTKNHHPTVKPIKLMEYLIRLITPSGGIVLDPFMGSGSTGVAAKLLGYQFIGIEMNAQYCEIAKRRIEA